MKIISRKKKLFPISEPLLEYLKHYTRSRDLPVSYSDLTRYQATTPLIDKNEKDTLWATCMYSHGEEDGLYKGLSQIYSQLKAAGDQAITDHLHVERVDFCEFGNSKPFRVRIVNQYNDNYDHFYMKIEDASRIYGLELEHLLSPNRINYLAQRTRWSRSTSRACPATHSSGILERPSDQQGPHRQGIREVQRAVLHPPAR